MIKLLSIDSSTTSTGYAIYTNGQYNRCGGIDFSDIKDTTTRLDKMVQSLYSLIAEEKPDIIVVEKMSVERNAQTGRNLMMIIGAVYGKCIDIDIFFYDFTPSEWRKLVDPGKKPRKREELKIWSKNKAKEIFGVEDINDDISDAILIGLAYCKKFSDQKEKIKYEYDY